MGRMTGEPRSPGPLAVVAAGTGRYGDPWHPFRETADVVADVLADDGWRVRREDDVDAALGRLDDAQLLVVVAGDPWRNGETGRGAPAVSADGLRRALERGIGVLAVHNAVSTLRDYPEWHAALGGEWVVGQTWHPPLGELRVELDAAHPITHGLEDFVALDERYTDLRVEPDARVLARARDGARMHPLLWVRAHGASRVVASTLGHDPRSFEAREHRALLARAARWAAT